MKIEELWLIIGFLKFCLIILSKAQINLPPRFVIGGDMAHFSIPENVEVGSTVYKLRGTDPEELSVYFSISGEHFSVNKYSGDITLIKKLDREVNDIIEVIISITGSYIKLFPNLYIYLYIYVCIFFLFKYFVLFVFKFNLT